MSTLLHATLLVAVGCVFALFGLMPPSEDWLSPQAGSPPLPILSAETWDPGARDTPGALEHG